MHIIAEAGRSTREIARPLRGPEPIASNSLAQRSPSSRRACVWEMGGPQGQFVVARATAVPEESSPAKVDRSEPQQMTLKALAQSVIRYLITPGSCRSSW